MHGITLNVDKELIFKMKVIEIIKFFYRFQFWTKCISVIHYFNMRSLYFYNYWFLFFNKREKKEKRAFCCLLI